MQISVVSDKKHEVNQSCRNNHKCIVLLFVRNVYWQFCIALENKSLLLAKIN